MLGRKRDRAGQVLDSAGPRVDEQLRDIVADNSLPATRVGQLTMAIRNLAPGSLPTLPRFRHGAAREASFRANALIDFPELF